MYLNITNLYTYMYVRMYIHSLFELKVQYLIVNADIFGEIYKCETTRKGKANVLVERLRP